MEEISFLKKKVKYLEEELEQKEKQIKINYEAIDRLRKEIEDIKKYEILWKTVEQWQDLDMSINC